MEYDVVAIGELLIDFTGNGVSAQGNPLFEANPGGAPGNVLAMLAKLGKKTAFIGKVGDDMFGRMLKDIIEKAGINADSVQMEESANTTLAFVQNSPDGDREFSFFRKPGADTLLSEADVRAGLIQNCRIFHFGSLSLTHQPARAATQKAVALARKSGALVSFDPNLRPLLWKEQEDARQQILWGCGQCDILKIAEEELEFSSGIADIAEGAEWMRRKNPQIKLLMVTKGKRGSEVFWQDVHAEKPTYLQVKAIDTTGAGDTFCGSCLHYVLEHGLDGLNKPLLEEMLLFSNAAASLVSARKGAICSMPEPEEVRALAVANP